MMSPADVIDAYFLEHRSKLLDIAAFLDRVDRAGLSGGGSETGDEDYRVAGLKRALTVVRDGRLDRAKRVLELLSDPTIDPIGSAGGKGASGAYDGGGKNGGRGWSGVGVRSRSGGGSGGGIRSGGGESGESGVRYIDPPHPHGLGARRTTTSGWRTRAAVAVTEPAFWAGYDRSGAQGFLRLFPAADGV